MLHSTVDLRSIPLPDHSIDLIVLDQISSTYNLEDWDLVAYELSRILRNAGSIVSQTLFQINVVRSTSVLWEPVSIPR